MSFFFDALDEYDISNKEYCFLREDTNKYSSTFKVYIPKLMPLIGMEGDIKETRELFNDICINADDNRPEVNGTITTCNYMTVHRKRNSMFNLHPSTFTKGTRLICEFVEKNIRHGRITDEEYNIDRVDTLPSAIVRNPSYDILDIINVGDTVMVSYMSFTQVSSLDNSKEYDFESLSDDLHRYFYNKGVSADLLTGNITHMDQGVSYTKNSYREITMSTSECTVISKHTWGIIVDLNGVSKHILPTNIIHVVKPEGEYYGYFQDSYGGE